jgi:DNA-directed RNA polymerase subunit E'/Rpb7
VIINVPVTCLTDDLALQTGADGRSIYVARDDSLRLDVDSDIRVKIIGYKATMDKISVMATIREDFLC